MTAHVMSGDRESLLNQGMDDYLSKPYSKMDLLKMVHKWLNVENNDLRFPSPQENHNKFGNQNIALETIDHNALIQLGEDTDPGMLPTLIDTFIANIDDRMAAINQAASALDMRRLAEEAHSLKGSSATFGVVSLNRLAAELEIAAREEDLAFIRLNSHRIADECEATKIGLRKFLEGHRGTRN
jgi:HPt (histidine-containing phosphotransfer) domain-containing protein